MEAATEVCPEEGRFYTLTVTDAVGSVSTDSVWVCVVDVACNDNAGIDRIQVCINPSGEAGRGRTLCVPKVAVKFLLARGANLGTCGVSCEEYENETPTKDEQNLWNNVQVYPNPIIDRINVLYKTPVNGTVEVRIFDQLGRVVLSKQMAVANGRFVLDVTKVNLHSQFYYLQIQSEGGQKLVRILKK